MKCEACGAETTVGFPAVRQEGSTFNVDFIPGDLELGKFGAKGVKGSGFRLDLA